MTYEYMTRDLRQSVGFGAVPAGSDPKASIPLDTGVMAPASGKGIVDTAVDAAMNAGEEEEDRLLPFQETPNGAPPAGTWLQEHQTHITIISTVIGLLTFIGWIVLSPKKTKGLTKNAAGFRR